jgi:hypothetical protein
VFKRGRSHEFRGLRGTKSPFSKKIIPLPLDKGKGIKGIGFPYKNI